MLFVTRFYKAFNCTMYVCIVWGSPHKRGNPRNHFYSMWGGFYSNKLCLARHWLANLSQACRLIYTHTRSRFNVYLIC